jgi:uncharacterized protein
MKGEQMSDLQGDLTERCGSVPQAPLQSLRRKTIIEAIVGSTVHGTAVKDGLEDLDLMAVVLEDQKTFAGFNATDTWTARTKPMGVRSEAGDVDWVGYGLRKYLNLALKGNPSILLLLFAPMSHVREITPEGEVLRSLSSHIVSKQAYAPFRGYMRQQHERLLGLRGQRNVTRPELVEAYGYDTKYAAHVVRLGLQGEELLTTGRISLPMREADRELCVKVRTGGFSLAAVSEQIIAAERRLDEAFARSSLPERPGTEYVERWMLSVYLKHWTSQESERQSQKT